MENTKQLQKAAEPKAKSPPKPKKQPGKRTPATSWERLKNHLQARYGNHAVGRLAASGLLQAQLRISKPGDVQELEADKTAEHVMSMPASLVLRQDKKDDEQLKPSHSGRLFASLVQKAAERKQATTSQHNPVTPSPYFSILGRQRAICLERLAQFRAARAVLPTVAEAEISKQPHESAEEEEEAAGVQEQALAAKQSEAGEATTASHLEGSIKNAATWGEPLPEHARDFFEPRFGADFSGVRVHNDQKAHETSQAINARAYTLGNHIVFGKGEYAPATTGGRKLLAHELAHVVQQGKGLNPLIQTARLLDYVDKNQMHDPSRLTDAQIIETNEYKAYMNPALVWQKELHITDAEAKLACRLILRYMRNGEAVNWELKARWFANLARQQSGTAQEAKNMEDQLKWTGSSEAEFKTPGTAQSEFAKWLLASGAEPNINTGRMNCWEFVIFAAYRFAPDKVEFKKWALKMYQDAAGKTGMDIPKHIESVLTSRTGGVYDKKNPDSPKPLPGDIVIFGSAAQHVALSLGGDEVMSLWTQNSGRVFKTTIKDLMGALEKVDYYTAPWPF